MAAKTEIEKKEQFAKRCSASMTVLGNHVTLRIAHIFGTPQ
jgi:hypothetical protein